VSKLVAEGRRQTQVWVVGSQLGVAALLLQWESIVQRTQPPDRQ